MMEENVNGTAPAGIPVVEPVAVAPVADPSVVTTVESVVTADATVDVQAVVADVKTDVVDGETAVITDTTEAEGFFASVYDKIRAEVSCIEGDAVAFEAAVQTKIETFVSGIKAKLQSLHSGS